MKNQKPVISKQNKTLRVILKNRPQAQQTVVCKATATAEWPCLSIH